MSRTFEQVIKSRETDSWNRQFHGYLGTVSTGTISLSVSANTGRDQQFVTDLSFSSNLASTSVELLNGTAFLYQMPILTANERFSASFLTPLKTSQGTALNIKLYGIMGTSNINVSGYTIK